MSVTEDRIEALETRQLLSAGGLDKTFASRGEFASSFGAHAVFTDVAVQTDGKIVAVGAINPEKSNPKVLVARFSADGKLDKTFSGDGFDITTLNGHGSRAIKLLLLDHGKFLVAGAGPHDSGFIARYTTSGQLDSAFGNLGVVHEAGGAITDMALAPSDELVAVNLHSVFRFHAYKGNLDGLFGRSGVASVALHDLPDFSASHIAVGGDGRIVVGGTTVAAPDFFGDVIALRLKANGAIDTTFGDNGVTDEYVAGDDVDLGVQILPNKQILLETGGEVGENELILLDKDGSDIGEPFENQHFVGFDFPTGEFSSFGGFISDYVRQSDGKFVAVGEADDDEENPFIFVDRLRPDFSPDPKFGIHGSSNPISGIPRAIALTPSGDIIVAGASEGIETDSAIFASGKAVLIKLRG